MMDRLTLPDTAKDLVVIASVSGGKDSTALICALREAEIQARYVFADTGWEAPETYEYLDTLRRVLGITIDVVRSERGGMLDIARQKAGFPTRRGRWCTEELKLKPLRAYHERIAQECDTDTVSAVGIRAEESAKRACMAEWEFSQEWGGYVWRPLLAWSVADVLAIHHRHNVPIHPLYKRGHSRVGCRPCIHETKESIRLLSEDDPERIDLIDVTEHELTDERARRNASGEGHFEHPQATFFMPLVPGVPATIRDVVEWSRTTRGGRQLPMIREEPDGGCFRWGMCEPPTP